MVSAIETIILNVIFTTNFGHLHFRYTFFSILYALSPFFDFFIRLFEENFLNTRFGNENLKKPAAAKNLRTEQNFTKTRTTLTN